MITRRCALVFTVILFASGCGQDGPPTPDSPPPAAPAPGTWALAPEPSLSISALEGEALDSLRAVTGAAQLPDGRLVVATQADRMVRIFTADGQLIRTFGGRGNGPDRFQFIRGVFPYRGDSLAVVDQARVAILDTTGNFGRSVPMSAPLTARAGWQPIDRGAGIVDAFADGGFLAEGWTFVAVEGVGARRGRAALLHLSAEGQLLDTIGEFAHRVVRLEGGRLESSHMPAPLAYTVVDHELVVGSGDEPLLEVLAPDGTVRDTIPVGEPSTAMDRAAQTAFYERLVVQLGVADDPDIVPPAEMEGVFPDSAPRFHEVVADADGNLWLAVPSLDLPGEQLRWVVYSRQGQRLAEIILPFTARIVGFRDGEILLLESGERELGFLRAYRILKP
ncbi:MAG: hypothetical protein WEB88_17855 [Gemmatimonadota bacterium]